MLEMGGGPNLGQKARAADDGGELGPQHLDRDVSIVAGIAREVDGRHSAGADLAHEPIALGEACGELLEESGRGFAVTRARPSTCVALFRHRSSPSRRESPGRTT